MRGPCCNHQVVKDGDQISHYTKGNKQETKTATKSPSRKNEIQQLGHYGSSGVGDLAHDFAAVHGASQVFRVIRTG